MLRVTTAAEATAWVDALALGYEIPPVWSVVRDGRVVGTSTLHLAGGVAGVSCVATRPEERGRGIIGAHATAEPLRRALAERGRVGVLQSSPSGHGVSLRLGFADLAQLQALRLPVTPG